MQLFPLFAIFKVGGGFHPAVFATFPFPTTFSLHQGAIPLYQLFFVFFHFQTRHTRQDDIPDDAVPRRFGPGGRGGLRFAAQGREEEVRPPGIIRVCVVVALRQVPAHEGRADEGPVR